MRQLVTACLVPVLLAGCRVVPASPDAAVEERAAAELQPASGDTLRLYIGQSGRVDGTPLVVTVSGVATDGRCPVGSLVLCAWEGDAVVEVAIAGARARTDARLHTGLEPRAAGLEGHVVELLALDPVRRLDEDIPRASYRATLRVREGALEAPVDARLGDTTHIMVGRTVRLDRGRLQLAFLEKGAESRCPANAMCVRQGDAAARLRAAVDGRAVAFELHTSDRPRTLEVLGYDVHLVTIDPYPGTELPNVRMAPVAVVVVTRHVATAPRDTTRRDSTARDSTRS